MSNKQASHYEWLYTYVGDKGELIEARFSCRLFPNWATPGKLLRRAFRREGTASWLKTLKYAGKVPAEMFKLDASANVGRQDTAYKVRKAKEKAKKVK